VFCFFDCLDIVIVIRKKDEPVEEPISKVEPIKTIPEEARMMGKPRL